MRGISYLCIRILGRARIHPYERDAQKNTDFDAYHKLMWWLNYYWARICPYGHLPSTKSFRDLYLYWFTTKGTLVNVYSARAVQSPSGALTYISCQRITSDIYEVLHFVLGCTHMFEDSGRATLFSFASWDGPKILGQAWHLFLPDFGMDPNFIFFTIFNELANIILSYSRSRFYCSNLYSSRFCDDLENWRMGPSFVGFFGDEFCGDSFFWRSFGDKFRGDTSTISGITEGDPALN